MVAQKPFGLLPASIEQPAQQGEPAVNKQQHTISVKRHVMITCRLRVLTYQMCAWIHHHDGEKARDAHMRD
jgi:hypothetical protein